VLPVVLHWKWPSAPTRARKPGENALFRTVWDRLEADDILLADRYYCSYADIALLKQRDVDIVFRKHHNTLRELRFTITEKGKRAKEITLITTLLDAETFTKKELAQLYNIRWRAEIDLRILKTVMEMDVLRCKSPEMVRKEVWPHLLAYNLIRTAIAKAAEAHKCQPYEISFKGAMQTINCFRDYMLMDLTCNWYEQMLKAIVYHQVGNRPNRYEPRARKRRPKNYKLLQIPRDEARKRKPGKTYD
jgi:hypothetical protein